MCEKWLILSSVKINNNARTFFLAVVIVTDHTFDSNRICKGKFKNI